MTCFLQNVRDTLPKTLREFDTTLLEVTVVVVAVVRGSEDPTVFLKLTASKMYPVYNVFTIRSVI